MQEKTPRDAIRHCRVIVMDVMGLVDRNYQRIYKHQIGITSMVLVKRTRNHKYITCEKRLLGKPRVD